MSFYGNSFYYTAESFARVVLQNSGLNKYITTLSDEDPFKEVSSNDPVELDALQRNSGLGVQSGNHWIKLASSGNTFQVLHNQPAESDPNKQTVSGWVVEDGEVDENDSQKPTVMGWSQKITVPLISYDTAGHIIPTETVTYLKMPSNPTGSLEARMQQIDGKNAEGENEEPVGGSLKTAFFTRMQQIDGKNAEGKNEEPAGGSLKMELLEEMEEINGDDESSLKSKLNKAIEDFSANNEKITSLWGYVKEGWIDEVSAKREGLLVRVQNLENQIDQLISNKTETTE